MAGESSPHPKGALPFEKIPVWLRILLFGMVYYGCAATGNALIQPGKFVSFWLPSGWFVAVLLLHRTRHWPFFVMAAIAANLAFDLVHDKPARVSLLFATGNSLEALTGAWLVRRLVAFTPRLVTIAEVVRFFVYSALLSTTVSAFVGATVITKLLGGSDFWGIWRLWWSGDLMGILLVAPVVLAWLASPPSDYTWFNKKMETLWLLLVALFSALVIFQDFFPEGMTLKYLMFPIVLWAALRLGLPIATLVTLMVAIIAAWFTRMGGSELATPNLNVSTQTLALQLYLAVMALTGLVISAATLEQTATEKSLRESEARFQTLIEQAGDGFELLDHEGRYEDVNSASLQQLGYTRQEMLELSVFDVDPRLTREKFLSENPAQRSGQPLRVESVHKRKDGTTFPVEVTISWIRLQNEKFSLTLVRDISERKKAERQLQHSHQLMQYIIEHAQSAIAVHDRDLKYIYVSQRYLEQYNIKERNIIGRHHYEVFPDLPQKWRDVHQRALKGEVSSADADSYRHADGSVEWTRWECRPWYEEGGSIGGFIVYTEVITQRIQQQAALQESQQRLELACRSAKLGIWDWDIVNNRMYWDDQMFHLYGIAEKPQQYGVEIWQHGLHPDDKELALEACQAALENRKNYDVEFRIKHPDGSVRHIHANGLVQRDQSGKPVRMLGLNYDITDQKNLEARLIQAQKMQTVGHLAGGVAHDFNNILATIMLNLGMLQEDPGISGETSMVLNDLMKDSKRATSLVRQLLMFSRQSILDIKTLDLNEVVENLLKMLRQLIGEHVRLQYTAKAGVPQVDADPGMMGQVLMNLCVNARDAMPKGGTITIALTAVQVDELQARMHLDARPGRFVRLTVTDTGCGMDAATLQRIFEPFFTTKDVGKGSGLGLATVHGIVGQHKGWVEVDSTVGQGTTFKVLLPVSTRKPVTGTDALKESPHKGSETILVVEDKPDLRRTTVLALHRLGYQVLEAADGPEALMLWEQHRQRVDLLLTDMVMPRQISGLDLAEILRKTKPALKIIIVTGYSAEIVGIPANANIHSLQKPYTYEKLSQVVRQCLDHK